MAKKKRLFLSRMAENIARAEDAKARVRTAAALTKAEAYAFLQSERGGIAGAEAERRRKIAEENPEAAALEEMRATGEEYIRKIRFPTPIYL